VSVHRRGEGVRGQSCRPQCGVPVPRAGCAPRGNFRTVEHRRLSGIGQAASADLVSPCQRFHPAGGVIVVRPPCPPQRFGHGGRYAGSTPPNCWPFSGLERNTWRVGRSTSPTTTAISSPGPEAFCRTCRRELVDLSEEDEQPCRVAIEALPRITPPGHGVVLACSLSRRTRQASPASDRLALSAAAVRHHCLALRMPRTS